MHDYDIALKSVLQRQLRGGVFASWLGISITEWLSTELPEVRTRHADLLGRMDSGDLVHLELQSTNDPDMALRMAEYALGIYRRHRIFPIQIVLYVGKAKLSMGSVLEGHSCRFQCRIIDLREVEAEPLLASDQLDDNVIAILTRLSGERESIRRILERIAGAAPEQRRGALGELTLLAGLRQLGGIIDMELQKMPILDDIMDHDLYGPVLRKGIHQGRAEGLEEGERRIVLTQITRRFGNLPSALADRLNAMSARQIEQLSLRLLEARTLEELFG